MSHDDDDKKPSRWPLDLTGDGRDRHRVKTPPTGVSRAITQGAVLVVEVEEITTQAEVGAEAHFEDEPTDPTMPTIDQVRHTQIKHGRQIKRLARDHGALATTVARSEGKLDILVDVAARADQGELKKLRVNRPVAIIVALTASVIAIIEALR